MIAYSERALGAYARLFRPYNDIEVFVEDRTLEGVYERLVNKALNGRARVTKVVGLGGRTQVIRAAQNDNGSSPKPRLYIVDGDFELAYRRRIRRIPNLYRLKVYSIENLLLETNGVEELIKSAMPAMGGGAAVQAVDYEALVGDVEAKLHGLFVVMAAINKLDIREPFCRLNMLAISDRRNGRLYAPNAVAAKALIKSQIRSALQYRSIPHFRRAKQSVVETVLLQGLLAKQFVPAKKVHLWYLLERIMANGGESISRRIALSFLANYCEFELDPGLKREIRRRI